MLLIDLVDHGFGGGCCQTELGQIRMGFCAAKWEPEEALYNHPPLAWIGRMYENPKDVRVAFSGSRHATGALDLPYISIKHIHGRMW